MASTINITIPVTNSLVSSAELRANFAAAKTDIEALQDTVANISGISTINATSPIVVSGGSSPNISINIANTTQAGALTSTDWNTFNNKGTSNLSFVQGNGTVNGLTITGNATGTGGNLTLGGNLTGINLTSQVEGILTVDKGGSGVNLSTGSGSLVLSNSPNLTTPALGTPASGNLTNCNGNATGLTVGNATNLQSYVNLSLVTPNLGTPSAINLTNAAGLPVASPAYLGGYDVSGWITLGACAYVSADSPTFVMNMTGDATGYLSLGSRIKLTQTTVKYFVVTAIGAYSGGVTPITLYGGTDYTLANAAITLPYFSLQKAPFGFPMSPTKWDVVVNDTTSQSQATPTQNVYYNLGTTAEQIAVPIGAWELSFQVVALTTSNAAQTTANMFVALSTSNSSVSDADLLGYVSNAGASGTIVASGTITRFKNTLIAAKTLYYLIAKTNQTTNASIAFHNAAGGVMVLRARFLYL